MRPARPRFGHRMPARLAAAAVAVLFGACASTIPRVDPGDPRFSGLPADRISVLRRGREEYIAKCSGCHPPHPPGAFSADRWEDELVEMADRARLDDGEFDRILDYLAASAGEGPAAGVAP